MEAMLALDVNKTAGVLCFYSLPIRNRQDQERYRYMGFSPASVFCLSLSEFFCMLHVIPLTYFRLQTSEICFVEIS